MHFCQMDFPKPQHFWDPLWLKNLQWFPTFHWIEYTCLALTCKALHNPAPNYLSRFIFYCFTVFFAPPSSFASLRVGSLPSLSVLFQKLAPLSFLLYQKPTTWGDCPWPSVPGIPPWNTVQSFPDPSQALRAPPWTNQQITGPGWHPAGEWVSFAYRDQELSKWFYWAAPPWRREGS